MGSDVAIKKVSEMIVDVSGDLFQVVDNREEMQAHLDLVSDAWNMALNDSSKRKTLLKKFLKKQQKYAPSIEALKGLEWEIRRIMKQKDRLFPEVDKKIVKAEAVETGVDEYIIRAYFEGDMVP